ncbi:MAG: thioredoxin [Acidobacteria bacterium]|nr:MAG: thioredoxin [Acidobacteriota bacterium]MCE7956888.1 thioredoxin [Acidobacteria bacterium ACB2]
MRNAALLPLLAGALLAGCAGSSGAGAGGADLPGGQDPKTTVARVDGSAITEGDVALEAKPGLLAAQSRFAEEVHAQRVQALERLVERRLLEARAKKEGVTVEALVEREVTSKVPEPAEAELQAVYDQTKATGRALPPFSEVKAEVAAFVKEQKALQLRQALVAQLRAAAKVENLMPPLLLPKVEFTADGPSRGDAGAPVTIVEFSDYECGFCAGAEGTLRRVLDAYPGRVRLVHQAFPLSTIHPRAQKAAEAALCAGEQGRYWEMHESIFARQAAIGVDDLKARARGFALDAARFDACLDSGRTAALVDASRRLGESVGVTSTPTFFVNGRPLTGAQPFERFQELVDHELAAAGR